MIDLLTRYFSKPRIALFYQVAFSVLAGVLTACAANKANPLYSNLPAAPAPLGSVKQVLYTQIPFPKGNWVELAQRDVDGPRFSGADPSQQSNSAWGLIESGKLSAYLYVSTNRTKASNNIGFTLPVRCRSIADKEQKLIFIQDINGLSINDQNCLIVRYEILRPPIEDSLELEAWETAKKYGGLPREAVTVFIATTANFNYMEYSLYFFPERDEVPTGNWTSGVGSPEQNAYVASLVKWARGFEHWVVDGTKDRLSPSPT